MTVACRLKVAAQHARRLWLAGWLTGWLAVYHVCVVVCSRSSEPSMCVRMYVSRVLCRAVQCSAYMCRVMSAAGCVSSVHSACVRSGLNRVGSSSRSASSWSDGWQRIGSHR